MSRFLGLVPVMAILVLAPRALAGEGVTAEAPAGGGYVRAEAAVALEERLKAERAKLDLQAKEEVKKFSEQEAEKFKKATEGRKITVKVGGQEVVVDEPRDPNDEQLKPIESLRYRNWSLKAEDFKFDLPVEVFVPRVVGPKNLIGKDQVLLVLPFTITNTLMYADVRDAEGRLIESAAVNSEEDLAALKAKTEKDGNKIEAKPAAAELRLQFTMVTDKGVFTPETSGFVARESVDISTFKRRAWSKDLISFARSGKTENDLKPGETRAGVAVFPRFDPGATQVRIVVDGLNSAYDFKRDLRKVLVLEFVRPGNLYYPGQVKLALKRRLGEEMADPKSGYLPGRDEEEHHGFDWVWLWNWDAAMRVSDPKNSPEVPSPTGKEKFNFWTYRVSVPNRTGAEQPLTVEKVKTLVSLKIDVAGKEREVDVPLVDDGRMDVYKAAFFEAEGIGAAGDRFPKDKRVELSGKDDQQAMEFTVAFSDRDVDFESVMEQIHGQLDLDLAVERNAQKEGERKDVYKGPRQLSAAEVAQVRDQLAKKLPEALKAQLAKKVCAEITVKSGLASGSRVVNFSLYKPATVPAMPKEE